MLTTQLEDLDFADDVSLTSHRLSDVQSKTEELSTTGHQQDLETYFFIKFFSQKFVLKAGIPKTKHMRMNSRTNEPIKLQGQNIEEVEEFTYLGSMMTADGSCEREIHARLSKAGQAFATLRNMWKSVKICHKTKIRLFKSNVLSILLYGSESWKMTKTINHRLEVFQNRCLRKILKIFWPNTISNVELHRRTSTQPITLEIKQRRWQWIGHVLRIPRTAIVRTAPRWTPDGKLVRGRPKGTWRKTVERETKDLTWGKLEKTSRDRLQWRALVPALCALPHEEE